MLKKCRSRPAIFERLLSQCSLFLEHNISIGGVESMNDLQKTIEQQKQTILRQIETVCDEYWVWMDQWNKKQIQDYKKGIGPGEILRRGVCTEPKESAGFKKVYIVWRDFNGKGKMNRTFGKKLPVKNGVSTKHTILKGIPEWAVEKVLETEKKLIPLRDEMALLHSMSVKYKSFFKTTETKIKNY